MEYTDEELLELYRDSGISQRKLARRLGMSFNKLHGKIFRAQKREEAEDKVEYEGDENTRIITVKSGRIHTLDQLLEYAEVDLDEWIVDRYVVNKWEVGAKMPSGEIVVKPLFQVKAWLTARKPEPVFPAVVPVIVKLSELKLSKRAIKSDTVDGRILQLADPHFGFLSVDGKLIPMHDEAALEIALDVASRYDFSHIILAGDIIDLPEWTDKFIRLPEFAGTTQPSIDAASVWLAELCSASPESEKVVIEGNHDKRLRDYLIKHLHQAHKLRQTSMVGDNGVMSIPYLLDLEGKGIKYIGDYPRGEFWVNNSIKAIHGHTVRGKSGATAAAVADSALVTTLFGHVHRIELASKTLRDRSGARYVYAFCSGCLCRIDGTVPSSSSEENWQQGFGVIEFNDTTCLPKGIPITNGSYMKEI